MEFERLRQRNEVASQIVTQEATHDDTVGPSGVCAPTRNAGGNNAEGGCPRQKHPKNHFSKFFLLL